MNPKYSELPKTYQTIIDTLIDKMHAQSQKGMTKYGQSIDDNQNQSKEYWQNHLLEEIADGLVYLQKLIEIE